MSEGKRIRRSLNRSLLIWMFSLENLKDSILELENKKSSVCHRIR